MSGVLTSPFYANLLGRWLTNDTYPLRDNMGEVMQNLGSQQMFKPASPEQEVALVDAARAKRSIQQRALPAMLGGDGADPGDPAPARRHFA